MMNNNIIHKFSRQESQDKLFFKFKNFTQNKTNSLAVFSLPSMLTAGVSITNKTTAIQQAITTIALTYSSRCRNILWCNDSPITVYPSNRNICL